MNVRRPDLNEEEELMQSPPLGSSSGNLLGSLSPDYTRSSHPHLQQQQKQQQQRPTPRTTFYDAVEEESVAPLSVPNKKQASRFGGGQSSFLFGEQSDEEDDVMPGSGTMVSPRQWVPQPQSRGGDDVVTKSPPVKKQEEQHHQPDVAVAVEHGDDPSPRNLWLTDGLVIGSTVPKAPVAEAAADCGVQTDYPEASPRRNKNDDIILLFDQFSQTEQEQPTIPPPSSSSCQDCDRIRSVLTVSDDANFEQLQQQWKQLSKMFGRFESTCQKVIKKANQQRAESEEESGSSLKIESDIRTGVLRMVEMEQPKMQPPGEASQPEETRPRSSSAIDAMRSRATRTATSNNTSRSSSADVPAATTPAAFSPAEQRPHALLVSTTVSSNSSSGNFTAAAAATTPMSSRTQQPHFVALRKCLIKTPQHQRQQMMDGENAPPPSRFN